MTINIKHYIIVFIFVLCLLLPLLDMLFGLDNYKHPLKYPKLLNAPELAFSIKSIVKYPLEYTNYFNNTFGYRNLLLRVNSIINYNVLNVSPTKEVIIGKDGWLFYAAENVILDYPTYRRYDEITIDKWARSLEMKRRWLSDRGIHYLFVIAPNKSTIYGEYLPDIYNRYKDKSVVGDFLDYLKKYTHVEFVNVEQALMAAKVKERVYHKTDTHWNDYGAFLAYNQIMQSLVKYYPSIQVDSLTNYNVKYTTGNGIVLARMMGGPEFIKEVYIKLEPKTGNLLTINQMLPNSKEPVIYSQNAPSLPRAIIFHDSFFTSITPFLTQHFQYVSYYWQNWDKSTPIVEIVSSQAPNIVIEEVAEWFIKDKMVNFVDDPPSFLSELN